MDNEFPIRIGFADSRSTHGSTEIALSPTEIFSRWLCLVLIAMCLIGCGSGAESTVSGTVTLDGNPLARGTVAFIPVSHGQTRAAAGQIDSNGEYVVAAAQTGGLPAGEYLAKVSSRGESKPHPDGGPPSPGALLIPKRYLDARTSGFQFNVEPGGNTIDLKLTSEKK